jgi:hypothetical protein
MSMAFEECADYYVKKVLPRDQRLAERENSWKSWYRLYMKIDGATEITPTDSEQYKALVEARGKALQNAVNAEVK